MEYDFSGWATRNNLKCSDGRTIMKDAFKDNDGQTVPLVWNHQHNEPTNVLGHALLENREEGVYAYCKLNDTPSAEHVKLAIKHGDISALSIYANRLQQRAGDVFHGAIREVSLVLSGANPGAFIDSVMAHGEESEEEAIIYTGEDISLTHAEDEVAESEEEVVEEIEEELEHADGAKEEKTMADEEKTVADVIETMNEEQKNVLYALVGAALEGDDEVEHSEGGYDAMKHNVFENDEVYEGGALCHADQGDILDLAKKPGMTLQSALEIYAEENDLQHDAISSGFAQDTADGNISWLFPEYKDVRPGAPELLTNDQGWVGTVMNKVHKSPISRIRTSQVDIRNLETLRAKGYQKGKEKGIVGNFRLVRRTTDPQTVYVKSALHRDDVVDITDFDYVQYLYKIDRMNLNEELATAIMLGDGREDGAEGKIDETKIRPIWTDDDLYTIHVDLKKDDVAKELQGEDTQTYFGDNFVTAEAMVNTVLYARENFKGTGTPDMYITPHMLNVMLLARDRNGHRLYSSKAELATALNVGAIHTAEQFEGKTRKNDKGESKKLLALIVNLADYSLGATKGGEITHFTDFDIDFNQLKSLLETRCSGALTRVYSAIAIEEPVASVEG